ncbi:hypothetical protein [Streptomyces coeruleorubidus]|uniref:Uncharacterized protein n=1 Tax=Streptomyces coeruleorubidus TaxID=116188 RepID=A0A5J6I002_STRC4|nr:hypothetical protein [Streptomyces coeruleorubidus]QEV24011.1 hypothetical protein CP976_07515 [Streptomyces coeruleorubidus]GGT85385.1 hypothetical protein GCM10010256_51850 [Streptomyces coeruleorubidus]
MLDVAYEAVEDLPPGRLAKIDEDRGRIRVRLDKNEPLADVVRQLNIEIDEFMAAGHWFQLYGDEIVSRATPGCPLRIRYILKDDVPDGVGIGEGRGVVRVYIGAGQTVEQFAAAMNPVTKDQLDGGRWFQLFGGEIIDNSPPPMSHV